MSSLLSLTSTASLQRGELQTICCCWTPAEVGAAESALPLSGECDDCAAHVDLVWRLYGDCMEKCWPDHLFSQSISIAIGMVGIGTASSSFRLLKHRLCRLQLEEANSPSWLLTLAKGCRPDPYLFHDDLSVSETATHAHACRAPKLNTAHRIRKRRCV